MFTVKSDGLQAGLILERAREPDALYFALGLSYFASSEPGRLSLIGMDSKRFSWLSEIFEKSSSFDSFFDLFTNWIILIVVIYRYII